MSSVQHSGRVDAEGAIVAVRWLGVAFAVVQTATYYRPFPAGVEAWAWILNAVFAVAALGLTLWWRRLDRLSPAARRVERRRFSMASLVVDGAFASALTWIYAFDPETAIFAVLYVVAIEGAFRYGRRGALLTMVVLTIAYTAREVWAARTYDVEALPASVSFRMGVGFLIAALGGVMADRYEREHQRLAVALQGEQAAAAALRSLDELRSTFLAAVSHELRTPLTSILGFSLTIQDRSPELAPPTRLMLDQVVDEFRHLEHLLEDLLDIERMGRGSVVLDRRRVDVVELAREAAGLVANRTARSIQVEGDAAMASVDARKVERIVENLLGNAAKYSPDGTDIHLHVERIGPGVDIVVEDAGPGVPEELRTSIFAPFERGLVTSQHQPGTGIGLSLVDRFARLHGGRAWVEDRDGEHAGAAFHVYLPDGPEGSSIATVADEPFGARVDFDVDQRSTAS